MDRYRPRHAPRPAQREAPRAGQAEFVICDQTIEVTFHEVRAHLGVETQRQWSEKAIRRTTPVLLALFSLVVLMARELLRDGTAGPTLCIRRAAWYDKPLPTFVDTLALVRRQLWPVCDFSTSTSPADVVKIPRALLDRMAETLAFAA